jgi:hypothetical protein
MAAMTKQLFGLLVIFVAALWVPAGCETYDSPPRPAIDGLVDGALSDSGAPIVIHFSEPIDPATLQIKLTKLETTEEGQLFDEDDDEATVSTDYFSFNPVTLNNFGGTGELLEGDTAFRITPDVSLPVGPSLAVIIEPGLKDLAGNEWLVRQRLVFGYRLSCDGTTGTDKFPSGAYFLIANVSKPIQTQIQLWGQIEVDTATGQFRGQFTNADRNADPDRCDPPCMDTEACRTLPEPKCVVPSEEAGSEDEYPDYIANDVLPVGYSFTVEGCVVESGEAVVFVNLPADVDILQPDVFVQGIQLTASFAEADGAFRATGGVIAEKVFIGDSDSGPAEGTMVARLVAPEDAPPGIPGPPPL